MHEDGELHPVIENLNMVARGDDIIGWDRNGQVAGIYNEEGDSIFQSVRNRTIRIVTAARARYLGVLDPSPTDPDLPLEMYTTRKRRTRGE